MIRGLRALAVARVRVLGADQKKSGLSGREWSRAQYATEFAQYCVVCGDRSEMIKFLLWKI